MAITQMLSRSTAGKPNRFSLSRMPQVIIEPWSADTPVVEILLLASALLQCHPFFVSMLLASLCSARCAAPHSRQAIVLRNSREARCVIGRDDIDWGAGGLISQVQCRMAAVILTVTPTEEVLLPHKLSRSSFNATCEEQEWHKESLDTLLNIDSIAGYWRHRGMIIHNMNVHSSTSSTKGHLKFSIELKREPPKLSERYPRADAFLYL